MFKGLLKKSLISIYVAISFFGFFSFMGCTVKDVSKKSDGASKEMVSEEKKLDERFKADEKLEIEREFER